jgi:hypothetical protein
MIGRDISNRIQLISIHGGRSESANKAVDAYAKPAVGFAPVTADVRFRRMMKIMQSMRRYRPLFHRIVITQTVGVAISITCALSSGCATSSYMKDRMTDGSDIFTATAGKGIGVKARVGPVQAGAIDVVDKTGLRGGRLYRPTPFENAGADICIAIVGLDDFNYMGRTMGPRRKEFATTYCLVPMPYRFKGGPQLNASYWTQIEVVLGVGGTLRLGFNPGELVDFTLGWFGIDIYGDDIEMMRTKSESNTPSEATR